ncbi:hypothetical protein BDF19DRAFT_439953, partial [Syncephalis fuscata]
MVAPNSLMTIAFQLWMGAVSIISVAEATPTDFGKLYDPKAPFDAPNCQHALNADSPAGSVYSVNKEHLFLSTNSWEITKRFKCHKYGRLAGKEVTVRCAIGLSKYFMKKINIAGKISINKYTCIVEYGITRPKPEDYDSDGD